MQVLIMTIKLIYFDQNIKFVGGETNIKLQFVDKYFFKLRLDPR